MIRKVRKKNPVLIFNIAYWVSFFTLYLPQYFFPNNFFSKVGVTWFLLLGTNVFSFIEPKFYLWILYGTIFTAVALSVLMVVTKKMNRLSRVAVFLIYLALNTSINVVLTDW